MITITKRHEWDMGHRLGKGYTSKCKHLHGHRYVAEMTFSCDALNSFDMVLDFGEIKSVCGRWIDEHIDHAALVFVDDISLSTFLGEQGNRHHVVPFNTTVENIVVWLAEKLQACIDSVPLFKERNVKLVKLKVNETPNGWATWERA